MVGRINKRLWIEWYGKIAAISNEKISKANCGLRGIEKFKANQIKIVGKTKLGIL